jgi:hypothetical protein
MNRRRLVALATTILLIGGPTAIGGAPCPVAGCSCPQSAFGWVLFEDSNPGVPDFWWQDSLEVLEISVCSHGINFQFLACHDGNLYVTALVFADPNGDIGETRSRFEDYCIRTGRTPEENGMRYRSLRTALGQIGKGLLETDGIVDFRNSNPEERPVILNPARLLHLRWGDEEIRLRGYLDVFMNLVV